MYQKKLKIHELTILTQIDLFPAIPTHNTKIQQQKKHQKLNQALTYNEEKNQQK